MGYVYLLNNSITDEYKIGYTKNDVEKRVKQLQTGSSGELFMVHCYESEFARKIENALHRRFKHVKMLNEWFTLPDDDVLKFLTYCEQYDHNFKLLTEQQNPFFK